uniref:Uncharacterized protein n=1 Tax=Myoviridae sp. ctWPU11 TaxID=2825118 RepID=A0A8S5UAA0_9CAUD|nr:MAG TPA: hypothetical protein [Myoviridae sp. ctWPU11]
MLVYRRDRAFPLVSGPGGSWRPLMGRPRRLRSSRKIKLFNSVVEASFNNKFC